MDRKRKKKLIFSQNQKSSLCLTTVSDSVVMSPKGMAIKKMSGDGKEVKGLAWAAIKSEVTHGHNAGN